ncbi:MAG: DUF167 domain-containing protein [Myxococcales bacterium]|nr:DUF167 domain-containing protein [Myxococcales bacterium]
MGISKRTGCTARTLLREGLERFFGGRRERGLERHLEAAAGELLHHAILLGEQQVEILAELVRSFLPRAERALEPLREAAALDQIPDREDDLRAERARRALEDPEHDVLEDQHQLGLPVRVEAVGQVALDQEHLPAEGARIVVPLGRLAHAIDVDREGHEVDVGHAVPRRELAIHDRREPELVRTGLGQARLVAHVPELATITVEEVAGAVRFEVRVSPRASRDEVGGIHDGALRVKTTAPPVDGQANAAIVKLLSKALGVPKRAVRIVGGETNKSKRVEVEGVTAAAVRALV